MKIQTLTLLKVLPVLLKAVPSKPTLTFTQNIRILQDKGDNAILLTSDGDTSILVTVPLEASDPEGTLICINAKTLFEIMKTIADPSVTLSVKDSTISVEWSNGHATLPQMEFDYTPTEPGDMAAAYTVPGDLLAEAVGNVAFAISDDELRPTLKNIFFNFTDKNTEIVASDSRVLMYHNSDNTCDEGTFLLPEQTASVLKMICADQETVTFTVDNTKGTAVTGSFKIYFRPGTGKYPNYKALFPDSFTGTLRIDVKTLLTAIKTVAVCNPCIKMHIEHDLSGGTLTISSTNPTILAKSTETIPCDYDGEPLDIAFKASSLTDILSNTDFETVNMGFLGPTRPITVSSADDEDNVRGILVPIAVPKGK